MPVLALWLLEVDVYKADYKIATSGATLLADLDQRGTCRAIDSATGSIPSLFCAITVINCTCRLPLNAEYILTLSHHKLTYIPNSHFNNIKLVTSSEN